MAQHRKLLTKATCKPIQIHQAWNSPLHTSAFLLHLGSSTQRVAPRKSIVTPGKLPRNSSWPKHCPVAQFAFQFMRYPDTLQASKFRLVEKPEHSASLLCVLQSEWLCYTSVVGGGYAVNGYKCLLQWKLPKHEYGFQPHFHSLNYFADGLITWG